MDTPSYVSGIYRLYNVIRELSIRGERFASLEFEGHPSVSVDTEKLKKELGDVAWYLAEAAHGLNVPLSEILQGNLNKLHGRYPNGFSSERSMHRENAE